MGRGVLRFGLLCLALLMTAAACPLRREVSGISMAPSILPGDIVTTGPFPGVDRFRKPARNERWTCTAPDGTAAVKRIAAVGGQRLDIVEGDLSIDGRIEPVPPDVLCQTASVVERSRTDAAETDGPGTPVVWEWDGRQIYDDAAFAPDERRLLLPVWDVGVAVLVRTRPCTACFGSSEVTITVGDHLVTWSRVRPGRTLLLAGLLDGHLVAAAWSVGSLDGHRAEQRGLLPPGAPMTWPIRMPLETARRAEPPVMSIAAGKSRAVEEILVWRDVFHRPAANGVTSWRLGVGDLFMLGDFPSGSIDSRHWGPLPRTALRHRVRP